MMNLLLGLVLALAWVAPWTQLEADETSRKYSIESRYAYAMGYRVGQSMRAQGLELIDDASLVAGIDDLLQGNKTGFERALADDASASAPRTDAYLTGYRLGQSLQAQGVQRIDTDSLVEGIGAALQGSKPRLSEIEMNDALNSYLAYQKALMKNDARANLARANAYLKSNATRPGVQVLASGLQYEVLRSAGEGPRPRTSDSVVVYYQGSFIDGEVFDSTRDSDGPARLEMDAVIPGFREALTRMRVGDSWRIHVPPALGYGRRGVRGLIGANELLIFEIELLAIR